MTIGESLKRARKKMGLELDDVVRATKIAKMFLIALENDDISSLPPGVYTRNFLRTYARFLKLDEDILTAEFHEQYAIKPQFAQQKEQTKIDNLNFMKQRNRRFIGLVVLIVVPLTLFWLYWQNQKLVNDFFYELTGGKITESAPVTDRPLVEINKADGKPPALEEAALGDVEKPESAADPGEDVDTPGDDAEPVDSLQQPEAEAVNPSEPEAVVEEAPSLDQGGEDVMPVSEPDVALPLASLDGITVFPESDQPTSLENTFVIRAKSDIWLYVEIDGVEVTNRQLPAGQMRCYRYGERQTVNIGDVYQVSIQNGTEFRERASEQRVFVKIVDFGPGEFFEALDLAVKEGLEEAKKMREE